MSGFGALIYGLVDGPFGFELERAMQVGTKLTPNDKEVVDVLLSQVPSEANPAEFRLLTPKATQKVLAEIFRRVEAIRGDWHVDVSRDAAPDSHPVRVRVLCRAWRNVHDLARVFEKIMSMHAARQVCGPGTLRYWTGALRDYTEVTYQGQFVNAHENLAKMAVRLVGCLDGEEEPQPRFLGERPASDGHMVRVWRASSS